MLVALVPVLGFAALVALAATGLTDALDPDALARGHLARRAIPPTLPLPLTGTATGSRALAARWVATLNSGNGDAIEAFDVDHFGNLYLMLAPQFDSLDTAQQAALLDQLGGYWRQYLAANLGAVPTDTTFAPGILVVDETGLRAENRNGRIRVFAPSARRAH